MRTKRTFLAIVIGLILTSCQTPNSVMKVELKEWEVELDRDSLTAGEVTFEVTNKGKIPHQMLIIKTDKPPDDLEIDPNDVNKVVEEQVVAKIEEILPGKSMTIKANLTAGNYVVICNLPTHHRAGMYVGFSVK